MKITFISEYILFISYWDEASKHAFTSVDLISAIWAIFGIAALPQIPHKFDPLHSRVYFEWDVVWGFQKPRLIWRTDQK
jgi:hypothetical protein